MNSNLNEELFAKADYLSDQSHHLEAYEIFLKLAADGDKNAMSRLAIIYFDGLGVKKDFHESIKWDMRAIEAGDIVAMSNLALTYCSMREYKTAKYWFERATMAGDGDAALNLAKLLRVSDFEREKIKQLLQTTINSNFVTPDAVEEAKSLLELIESELK